MRCLQKPIPFWERIDGMRYPHPKYNNSWRILTHQSLQCTAGSKMNTSTKTVNLWELSQHLSLPDLPLHKPDPPSSRRKTCRMLTLIHKHTGIKSLNSAIQAKPAISSFNMIRRESKEFNNGNRFQEPAMNLDECLDTKCQHECEDMYFLKKESWRRTYFTRN